ncbi:acyl-CoA dehydrogenase family protein [Streptomyces sp. NPDC002143]
MSDHLEDLSHAVRDLLAARHPADAAPVSEADRRLWDDLEKLGFTSLTVPEELDGVGGTLLDAAVMVREAARASASIPLAEALFLAGPLLAASQTVLPTGMLTVAAGDITATAALDGSWRITGSATQVPWLRSADWLVTLVSTEQGPAVALIPTDRPGLHLSHGANQAGEQRDGVAIEGVDVPEVRPLPARDWHDELRLYGATARAVQLAGAARVILESTAQYVSERVQFGRPLARFQAVQQQLAQLAGAVVAVEVAADAAVLATFRSSHDRELTVATAKAEASALARPIAAIAHQLHGAIGFTREHRLGSHTTRLWSWRDEYGNELYWQRRSADLVMSSGDLWQLISDIGRAASAHATQGSRTRVS